MSPLLRTLEVALVAALVALALGLAWAALARVHRLPGGRLWRLLELAPLIAPPYLAAMAWLEALGPAGWLARALGTAPTSGAPAPALMGWVDTPVSAGLVLGGCWFPLVSLAAGAALSRIDPGQLEAARLARGERGVWALRWASARGAALAAALGVFALAAVELAVPLLLRVDVQSERVLALQAEHRDGEAIATALPLIGLAWIATAVALLCAPRRGDRQGEAVGPIAPAPLAPVRGVGASAALAICLLPGLLLPATWLLVRLARAPTDREAGPFGAAWGSIRLALRDQGADAWNSICLGVVTATTAAALALGLGWGLRRARRAVLFGSALLGAGLAACPGPLVGFVLLRLLIAARVDPLLEWVWAPALASLLRWSPLAVALAWVACAAVPREQEEAAALAGRGRLATLLGVGLPRAAPALLAGWTLVYLLTVTEYAASVILSAPGTALLAVSAVNEAHYGQGDVLAGQLALLVLVMLGPPGLFAAANWCWASRPARTPRGSSGSRRS